MKALVMPEVVGQLRGSPVKVPEGWRVPVPTILGIDREFREWLVEDFQSLGLTPAQAEARAAATVQLTLESAYKKHYGDAIRRYARLFAERYPHLWNRETGLLEGFDAEVLAVACQPHEQVTQRRKSYVRGVMRRMAEEIAYTGGRV
jgi:hypothetical protein